VIFAIHRRQLAHPSAAMSFMSIAKPLVVKTQQRVEKVVVGPGGGPQELENKAKILQKRRFQPLNRAQKRARRSSSTRWLVSEIPKRRRIPRYLLPCLSGGIPSDIREAVRMLLFSGAERQKGFPGV
jgi:hypothetical protein